MPIITVSPAGQPPYQVIVEPGCRRDLAARLQPGDAALALIADRQVWSLHGPAVEASLSRPITRLTFAPGEASKTRETKARLEDEMLAAGLGRDTLVVALGGGVTTDLAGFVAATFMRGVAYLSVPTTLLAMVDAAIGGKTGVDHPAGKNLIGAFHQPRAVLVDPELLESLAEGELDAGLAEMVKHALIADPDALDQLVAEVGALRRRQPAVVTAAVARSLAVKAAVLSEDVTERGRRAVLNAGHTLGHGVEQASGYRVPHGLAVSIGLVAEARLARRMGVMPAAEAARVEAALEAMSLPVRLPRGLEPATVVAATGADKKNLAGEVRCSLLSAVGRPARGEDGRWTMAVEPDAALATLEELR